MVDVNLIPEQRLMAKRRKARIRVWMGLGGAYLAFLGMVLFSVHLIWMVDDRALLQDYGRSSRRVEQYNASILRLRTELARISATLQTHRVINSQPDWSKLLTLLGNTLGDDVVLTYCRLVTLNSEGTEVSAKNQASLTTDAVAALFKGQRYVLTLAGFGRRQNEVSQFAVRLEKSGLFDGVNMTNQRREHFGDDSAIAFHVECRI